MSQKRINDISGIVVTAGVISNMFGCTTRWVRSLAEEGIIDRLKSGSYELQPTVNKYINHLKLSAEASTDEVMNKEEYWTEKTLHEKAKREIAELELAKMKGTMHKAEDVEEVMTDMLERVRSKIMAIPSKLSPMLIARNEITVIEGMLEDEIYNVLQELSDYSPDIFRGEEYIDLDNEGVEADIDAKDS